VAGAAASDISVALTGHGHRIVDIDVDQDNRVLVTGDDDEAKKRFFRIAEGTPFRYLDAGPLVNSRTVERLTFITSSLGRQLHSYPRMNWRLLTQPVDAGAPALAG